MSQNKIYVGNIAFTVSEENLKETFSQYGLVEDIKLVIDRATGRSRGFAFITFQKQFDAEASLQLNDTDIGGRKISVSMAKEREKKPVRKYRR
jgi:cold-inducible RNA-binding protein